MQDLIASLNGFFSTDTDWVLANAVEQAVPKGEVLVQQDSEPAGIYFVIDGLFEVRRQGLAEPLARLSPGAIAGEMSFLDGLPTSASVVAAEPSHVLTVPRSLLATRLSEDLAFASRFYRAAAAVLAGRIRERHAVLDKKSALDVASGPAAQTWQEVEQGLRTFKELMSGAARAEASPQRTIPANIAEPTQSHFTQMTARMNDIIGEASDIPEVARMQIGTRLQDELLPFLLLSQLANRIYYKPRGYAGDFFTIEVMYQAAPGGTNDVGRLVDRCFLDLPAAKAVRNRRGLLRQEIRETVRQVTDRPVRVMSIACGPAAELLDVYEDLPDRSRLQTSLLDVDAEAIEFVRQKIERTGLTAHVKLIHENALYLSIGRRKLALEPQDLVYSIGLIDYFQDKTVIKLLDYIHSLLRPGGRVILGNFHPKNSTRAMMDYVLDWKLIHRSEDDMHALFRQSAFGAPCSRILYEDEGINLFAEGTRQA